LAAKTVEELLAEVAKWKKATTDVAFTAERALARLILAERVCEKAKDVLAQARCSTISGVTWGALKRALEKWNDGILLN
jgi:hypothetical protein